MFGGGAEGCKGGRGWLGRVRGEVVGGEKYVAEVISSGVRCRGASMDF